MSEGTSVGVKQPTEPDANAVGRKRPDALLLAILALALCLSLLTFLIIFLAPGLRLVEVPSFVPVVQTFSALSFLCIAFMALGRHRVLRDTVSYWLGITAGSTTILTIFFVLSWPGLRTNGDPLVLAFAQSDAWSLMIFKLLLAVMMIITVTIRWPGPNSLRGSAWTVSVLAIFAFMIALGAFVGTHPESLPALVTHTGEATALRLELGILRVLLFCVAAALAFFRYYASRDKLTGYIALMALAMIFASASRLDIVEQYALLWYVGRLVEALGGLILLFGLLWEYVWLYRSEQDKALELEAVSAENRIRADALETILGTVPAGVIIYSPDGHILKINAAARDLLGYDDAMIRRSAEERAKSIHFVDDEGHGLALAALLSPAMSGEPTLNRTMSWQLREGRQLWLNVSVAPLRDADGNITRAIAAFSDVTTERRIQEELQRVAETLRQLVDALPVNVLACDAAGNYTLVNQSMRELMAVTGSDLDDVNAPGYPFFRPDGTPLPLSEMPLQTAMRVDGAVDNMLVLTKRPNGEDEWHSISARPLHAPDGSLNGAVSAGLDITSIVKAQAELERLEREAMQRVVEWETLFESLTDEVLVIGNDGRITKANGAAKKSYGVEIGETIQELAARLKATRADGTVPPPEDRPSARARRGESVMGVHEIYTAADGTVRHVLNSSSPVIVGGTVSSVVSIRHDITELIVVQEALTASEARYRFVGDLMPWGTFATDSVGRTLYVSPSFLDLLGHDLESLQQPGVWLDTIHPDDREGAVRAWTDALRNGSFLSFEYRIRDKDGQYHWVLTRGAPMLDQAGRVEQVVGVNIDIDQLKHAEEELRTQREFLQAVLDQMPSGVLVVEAQTSKVLIANRVMNAMWGRDMNAVNLHAFRTEVQAIGPKGTVRTPDEWPSVHALRGETVTNDIMQVTRPDGSVLHMNSSAAPIRDENGKIFAAIITSTDITEVALAQEELLRYRTHLEELVQARTLELQERTRLLESIFSSNLSALVLLDKQFNFVRVNGAYAKACGRPLDDFVGHNHFVDYPTSTLRERFEEVVKTKTPWEAHSWPFEFVDQPERGTTYWDLSVVPILNPSGQVELLLFSLQDVTERTLAGQELANSYARLAESERKYRELVEDARSAIVHWSSDGTILFVNEYLEELFGYEPGELLGQSITMLTPATLSSGMSRDEMFAAIAANPASFAANENENITKDGRLLWMTWSNSVIYDDQGNFRAVMAVGLDRTEQHEAQLQLRRLTAELALAEQKERRRIATLLHDDIAQILAFTKMRLASAMALATDERIKEVLEESSGSIDEAIRGARSLTLELSAPVLYERGLVEAIQWIAPRIAQKHGFEVAVTVTGEVRRLEIDLEVTLFQAVRELLTNVAKHAEAKHVRIEMSYRSSEVVIQVTDDGKGFLPAKAQRREESGFGLLNVRERLQYLGGSLTVDSTPGSGTRMIIVCPV
ncbi:MAG: PAS domain S-box protein [Bacteroidota bacterium]